MADLKITDATSGAPAQSTDVLPIVRSGAAKKLTVGDISASIVPATGKLIGVQGVNEPFLALSNLTPNVPWKIKAASFTSFTVRDDYLRIGYNVDDAADDQSIYLTFESNYRTADGGPDQNEFYLTHAAPDGGSGRPWGCNMQRAGRPSYHSQFNGSVDFGDSAGTNLHVRIAETGEVLISAPGIAIDANRILDVRGNVQIKGASEYIANAGVDGAYGDQLFFAASTLPTTYLHKISTSHSATAANSLLKISLATGANTFIDVLTLKANGSVDTPDFHIDGVNKRLGLGITPSYDLHISKAAGCEIRLVNSDNTVYTSMTAGGASNIKTNSDLFVTTGNTLCFRAPGAINFQKADGSGVALIVNPALASLGFFGHAAATQPTKAGHNNWAALSDVVSALVSIGIFDAA